jgi:glycogen operon protein
MSVGAPPDPLGPEGQVWGLPPPIPTALARDGYARFARTVASNMRHAGALRIDHVLGLQRLFWVPEGGSPADGTYVAMPFEALTAEIALESVRNRCWVIGEDLGTVPEGLREAMAAQNMAGFRVLYFEQDHGRFRPPAQYTREAVATVSTHDLPTLAGWWAGADIAERRELGLQPGPASDEAGRGREEDKRALGEALAAEGYPRPGAAPAEHIALETAAAIHGFVAAAPSQLMLAQVEDLAGEVTAVNLPGTDQERPNWRRKLAQPVPELLRTELADAILAEIRRRRPPGPAA